MGRRGRAAAAIAAGTLSFAAASTGARGADAPTSTDLKAAYCLRLTEASIKLMTDAPKPPTRMLEQLREQVRKKQEEKRERLDAYVKSHAVSLDSDAAREALKPVESDAKLDATGRRAVLDRCATDCKTVNPPPSQEGRACIDACAAKDEAVMRIERCTTVEWVPK